MVDQPIFQTTHTNNPKLVEAVQRMMPDLIMVLVQRAGGAIRIPVAEIDAMRGAMMSISAANGALIFEIHDRKKAN